MILCLLIRHRDIGVVGAWAHSYKRTTVITDYEGIIAGIECVSLVGTGYLTLVLCDWGFRMVEGSGY